MKFSVILAGLCFAAISATGPQLVVTAEGKHGAAPGEVTRDGVAVEVNRHPARVESWTPLRGDHADLQLYILIDDGEDSDLSLQFPDLKKFVQAQPASTKIGLAYLRNGAANIVAGLTADHEQVSKAMRIPSGQTGIAASPYMGISDLVKKWPVADARREILLISSGIDPWSPADPQNPYLQKAIADAQRAGVLVHSIYYAEHGHAGHSYRLINWGQNYLSELGDETGGEAYWQGLSSPVSLQPFLKDFADRLGNQYLLTIAAEGAKAGLQQVHVSSSSSTMALVAASKANFPK